MFCRHCESTVRGDQTRHILEHHTQFLEAIMINTADLTAAVSALGDRIAVLEANATDPAVEAQEQADIDALTAQVNSMATTPTP